MIFRYLPITLTILIGFGCSDTLSAPIPTPVKIANNNSNINSESQTIRVGVMAIRGVEATQKKWQPTLDYLSEKIPGYTFKFIPLEFDTIEDLVANQQVDFVLPNPGMYVELEWVYGARRIATLQNVRLGESYTQFGAVIFRRADRDDIQDLKDLKNQTFMAVNEIAFGGWQMAWETLKEAGVDPYRQFKDLQFGGSHDAVVYAVRDGVVDAGTVRTDTLERMELEGKINREDFVILNQQNQDQFPFALSTKLYPEWPFAVMPHTPVPLAEQVAIALMDMPSTNPAARAGRYEGWTIPANYQACHETLRNLRVRPYENWGKVSLQQVLYQYRYWLAFLGISIAGLSYGAVHLAERKRTEATLREINSNLENRVAARTSELEKAKQQAEKANKAKSIFLSNMSHELRTPLNGVLGYAQILRRDRSLTATQINGLNVIYNSGQHLLTLINDILDLSKIEAQKLELYPSDIDFNLVLENVVDLIQMRALQKQILFKYEPGSSLPRAVEADEKRLRQILINLLGNAVKFTDQGEVILRVSQIESEPKLAKIRFEVIDTGVGISAEQTHKIFQPFEQVGDIKRRSDGTGLGLAITRQLVELMGSQLQVKSEIGKGSTFWFDANFPIAETLTKSLSENPRNIIGYQGKKCTILVIDDKVENRLVLQSILEPLGFKVILGENGQEEIELAQKIHPDLILTDLVMPIKTGFEAIQEIRQLPDVQTIPIIAISASLMSSEQDKSLIAGCNDFLPKPINEQDLFNLIRKYLQLEWIYEQLETTEAEFLNSIELPPENELTQLKDLIKSGFVVKVKQKAEDLKNQYPKYTGFANQVTQLADSFEIQKLQSFLSNNPAEEETTSQVFDIPPASEIETLYDLAMLGSMRKIQEQATHIEELDPQYIPFAQKLKTLAQEFKDEEIITLIESYLTGLKQKSSPNET
ncbi:MAG: PhnD/SsuA/transferrin family substrate-binding protein [Cyanobacteria bacterium J06592_8]